MKVQYPGIDKAIENDLKSLSLLEAFSSPVLRKYHTKQTLEEVKDVFLAELDYAPRGRDGRHVPPHERATCPASSSRASTTRSRRGACSRPSSSAGMTYAEFCETASQEDRNQAGMTIWRFMFRSMLRYGILYADPHPGNYRFLGGGRVAFLDFGCVKVLPDELVAGMKRYMRAALDGDWDEFDRACVEVLGYDPDDQESWDALPLATPSSCSRRSPPTRSFSGRPRWRARPSRFWCAATRRSSSRTATRSPKCPSRSARRPIRPS